VCVEFLFFWEKGNKLSTQKIISTINHRLLSGIVNELREALLFTFLFLLPAAAAAGKWRSEKRRVRFCEGSLLDKLEYKANVPEDLMNTLN